MLSVALLALGLVGAISISGVRTTDFWRSITIHKALIFYLFIQEMVVEVHLKDQKADAAIISGGMRIGTRKHF
jgi:hypothetical protein